jgi:DNA replication protein DnaC
MEHITTIKSQLTKLKMSGISDTLEIRLMEAQNNNLAYSELLSMLLTDELEKRQERRLKTLIQRAGIGNQQTLENFDFTFNPFINAKQVRELAICRFAGKGENIFFIGPTGTGKTHLTKGICHHACRINLTVAYYRFYELFNMLKDADLKNKLTQTMRHLTKVDILAIDDFAFKKLDQFSAELLYAIVDSRYRQNSIIITSNRAITDWLDIFPDPVVANAILDRLAHSAHQIVIEGESFRKKFRPKGEKNE